MFNASIARRTHKIDFLSCLEHSARQFVIRRPGNRTEVISGYPWHGVAGRQTFVALPGITLQQNHKEDCIDVLDTEVRAMKEGMFSGSSSAAEASMPRSGSSGPCSGSASRSAEPRSGNGTAT